MQGFRGEISMRYFGFSFATAAFIIAAPCAAQTTDERIAEADARKAEAEAQQARLAADKARTDAAIPQSGAEGKATLAAGAGTIEAAMLVADAMRAAADSIWKRVGADVPGGTILLSGNESLSTDAYAGFRAEAAGLEAQFAHALGRPLPAGLCSGGGEEFAPAAGLAVSAIAGMLKSDVEVAGVTTSLGSSHLARALMEKAGGRFRVPAYALATTPSADNPVQIALCRLRAARALAEKATPSPAVKAVADRYDTFFARITQPDGTGAVPLATILRQSMLVPAGARVLRVVADAEGGSVLTRRNLWTALGASAVGVTGGVVASYTLSNPANGLLLAAGTLRCGTNLAAIRDIHRGRATPATCQPR